MKKIILVSVLASAVAALALAQCPGLEGKGQMTHRKANKCGMDCEGQRGMGMGRGQWWENPMMVKELGLSDKQAEQIDNLALQHRKDVIKLEADLKITELEFRDMMEGDPSEADVRKKAKAVSQIREKLGDLRIDHMLAVRRALTPEQQKKLKAMRPAMRQHRMGMGEKGGCEGMPCPPQPPAPPAAPK